MRIHYRINIFQFLLTRPSACFTINATAEFKAKCDWRIKLIFYRIKQHILTIWGVNYKTSVTKPAYGIASAKLWFSLLALVLAVFAAGFA